MSDSSLVAIFFSPCHGVISQLDGGKGYGSSAIVYVAKYKPLQKLVGVKQIELDRFESNQIEELRVALSLFVNGDTLC